MDDIIRFSARETDLAVPKILLDKYPGLCMWLRKM